MACDDMDFLIRNVKSRTNNGKNECMAPMATVISRKAWEHIEHFTEVGDGFPTYPAYEDHPDRTTRRDNAIRALRRIYAEAGTAIINDL